MAFHILQSGGCVGKASVALVKRMTRSPTEALGEHLLDGLDIQIDEW